MSIHKKKNSLIPLNFEYTSRSDQDERITAPGGSTDAHSCVATTLPVSPSAPVLRTSVRPKSPDLRPACNCNTPPTSSPPPSSSLPCIHRAGNASPPPSTSPPPTMRIVQLDTATATAMTGQISNQPPSSTTTTTTTAGISFTDTPFSVDSHRALVTLTQDALIVHYTNTPGCCFCLGSGGSGPGGIGREIFPLSEILSAEMTLPSSSPSQSKASRGLCSCWPTPSLPWCFPSGRRKFSFSVYTFRRSPASPSHWLPRCLTFSTSAQAIAQLWSTTITIAAKAATPRRPRRLLVLVNPYGGKKQARKVYEHIVFPTFQHAGIEVDVRSTQFGGHARALLVDASVEELSEFDGVVAVGGDGLFHEIVNAVLEIRSRSSGSASGGSANEDSSRRRSSFQPQCQPQSQPQPPPPPPTTTSFSNDKHTGNNDDNTGSLSPQQQEYSHPRTVSTSTAVQSWRIGHIPAGSTDAVACSLHGTRSVFSAAMRIALGDGIPLDVLRIDSGTVTAGTGNDISRFAVSMASYGFMGDLMEESEDYRWMGPFRYEVVGAKMLLANRSYACRISYLPATEQRLGSFTSATCRSKCDLCNRPTTPSSTVVVEAAGSSATLPSTATITQTNSTTVMSSPSPPSPSSPGTLEPLQPPQATTSPTHTHSPITHTNTSTPNPQQLQQPAFSQHSSRSLITRRPSEWKSIQGEYSGIMLVIMPCRSDKSVQGVARYGHLSDGNIHLVIIKKCSRLRYLRFLLSLSGKGLVAGKSKDGVVEVIPCVAVKIENLAGTGEGRGSTGTGTGSSGEGGRLLSSKSDPGSNNGTGTAVNATTYPTTTALALAQQQRQQGTRKQRKRLQSVWNVDGELLRCSTITAETHRGAVDVFARGVETEDEVMVGEKAEARLMVFGIPSDD